MNRTKRLDFPINIYGLSRYYGLENSGVDSLGPLKRGERRTSKVWHRFHYLDDLKFADVHVKPGTKIIVVYFVRTQSSREFTRRPQATEAINAEIVQLRKMRGAFGQWIESMVESERGKG